MVRCKIPSGLATAAQINQLARVADEFGGGRGHLTTRAEHAIPFRAAEPGGRSHARAGRRRPDQSRSLLQHGPQRHRLPLVRHRPRRGLRRAPLRPATGLRVPAQGSHRQPAAQIQVRVRRLRLARLRAGRHQRCGPARRDPRRPARLPHGDRRRPRSSAHRGATAGRVPPRRAPAQQVRSGAPRFQPLRQPPEQEQGPHEVRHARARLRVAQGTDREGIPGHPRQRRHRLARHGAGRLRRLPVAAAAAGRWRAAAGAAASQQRGPVV